jgi:hypothetical protein
MPFYNDSSAISALLYFAIGGTLSALVLLALAYYRQQRWMNWAALAIGAPLSLTAGIGTLLGAPLELQLPCGVLGGLLLLAVGAGSTRIHSLCRAVTRPAILGAFLLAASLATSLYIRTFAEPAPEGIDVPLAAGTEFHVIADVVAVTDLGHELPLFAYDNEESLTKAEQSYLAIDQFDQQIIRIGEPNAACNCHGWVYTGGRYAIRGRYIDELLSDNGYVEVAEPRADDVVIYRGPEGSVEHTGLIRHIGSDGLVLVESKWGPLGVYLHPLASQPYGDHHHFYRSPRAGHVVAIVPQTSLPETEAPVLARTLVPAPATTNPIVLPEQQPTRRIDERPTLRVPGQRRT